MVVVHFGRFIKIHSIVGTFYQVIGCLDIGELELVDCKFTLHCRWLTSHHSTIYMLVYSGAIRELVNEEREKNVILQKIYLISLTIVIAQAHIVYIVVWRCIALHCFVLWSFWALFNRQRFTEGTNTSRHTQDKHRIECKYRMTIMSMLTLTSEYERQICEYVKLLLKCIHNPVEEELRSQW